MECQTRSERADLSAPDGYMAPEVIKSSIADTHSDMYSVGKVVKNLFDCKESKYRKYLFTLEEIVKC